MNTDFLSFIKPYLIATQVLVSKRELNLDEIVDYCKDPNSVAQSGRKNFYKVIGDLFGLYRIDAPTDIYAVTPTTLNTYSNAYAKYVLKREVPAFDDVIAWNKAVHEMYSDQTGRPYAMLRVLLELNAYGADTLEIGMFICNTLALALNSQQLILTPTTYQTLKKYAAIKDWKAVDDFVMFYVRFREFLNRDRAFAYFLYSATVQYGYADPVAPDGSIVYAYNIGTHTLKAKYNSGSADWLLTIYRGNKSPIGSVAYSDTVVKCTAPASVTSELLAQLWYSAPTGFSREYAFDKDRFTKVFQFVMQNGSRQPLVMRHLRNNYKWTNGEYILSVYETMHSQMLHVRKSNKLVGVVESGTKGCFASSSVLGEEVGRISFINESKDTSLEDVLVDYIKSKLPGDPSARNVIHEIVNVLQQYNVQGLDDVRTNLPLCRY